MGKKIPKSKAKRWADKFKKEGKAASSAMFPKDVVLSILNQPGCEGLRIYNGYDEENPNPQKFTMFLVGTASDGNNLLPISEDSTTEQYSIEDDAVICPPTCPSNDL
jgi:hypothetical protein